MLNKTINLPVPLRVLVKGLALACVLSTPIAAVAAKNAGNNYTSKAALLVNITGKVLDADGRPIAGATVLVKGSKAGVRTDLNGIFRINVPAENPFIVISYVGYKVKEVNVAGQQDITITLEDLNAAIDEVVVTGYGTQKRSEIVGAVATIKGEELMDIPAPNIAGALRNRIAGLGVSEASGRPGARITLNVRNSTTSAAGQTIGSTSEPLYIIDGITVSSDVFDNLDASMVENITVLKDASAAIYGASGAKGVILVTTKRGKVGKPSISYNGYAGITDAARKPDMLSAYELGVMLNEGYRMNNAPADRYFSDADLNYLKGLNVDSWYDQLWQASLMQRHNLSISGGSEKVTFFVGGGYQNENGNYAGTKQDKYTFRSGLQATIIDGLRADVNFNIDNRIRKSNNGLGNDTDQAFFETVLSTPDWIPMEINGLPVNFVRTGTRNPLGVINSGFYDERNAQNYRVNASLSYQPKFLKGLTAKVQVSTGGEANNNTQYSPPYSLYTFVTMGNNQQFYSTDLIADPEYQPVTPQSSDLTTSVSRLNSSQGFLTLSYANTFGKHSIDAVAGAEQTMAYGEGLSSRYINQLIAGADEYWAFDINTQRTVRTIVESTKRSFFGRFAYDYDKKYLLQIVSRLDASSNFATGERWGLSPSLGLGWVVSQENFFKEYVSFINFLKLKANVGIAGDDRVADRLWQDRYAIDNDNGYLFGERYGVGLNPTAYPNPSITWEKKRTVNVGLETALLNNKLNISAEFFQNKVFDGFDQGGNTSNPLYSGIIAPPINYREAYNWGSEFSIGYNTRVGKDFRIGTNMNFGWGNSIVTQMLYPTASFLVTDRSDSNWLGNQFGTNPRRYNSSNVGYKVQGMFRTQEQVDAFLAENPNYRIGGQIPQPGWLIYEDTNGDGVVNTLDQTYLFDRTNSFFSTGITLDLGYKALSLSTNIFGRFGGKVFIDGNSRAAPTTTRNVMAFWKDRWTPDNPTEGTFPRADDPLIGANADFWALDATTIRINNMTLKYALPTAATKRIGLSNASILLTGNNLWTLINPFTYKDPYTNNAYNYPTVRTISIGLSAGL
ncbi:SusC/RagA family TonB-linked outer membrane protein [Sphingobacterium griseoflavum]|uniref:SusC/RagA family TonB-linked outer membrane protein n=1 Tax=Sphingobacterium griseoflavum TaxID=1474952 RepID=A0ABQ3HYZ9_9SPHI|nr:TonB-dependent receptor [Sphingobacterium griseoflavum]GHE41445.1 SusC/RagA family TonB-linked outer membrane protein [Sphingobacterium griseoflavum]